MKKLLFLLSLLVSVAYGQNIHTVTNSAGRFYYVKDYGAKGDSTTDDRAAIIRCFTAAKADSSAIVFFADGRYVISDSIVVPNGLTIMGTSTGRHSLAVPGSILYPTGSVILVNSTTHKGFVINSAGYFGGVIKPVRITGLSFLNISSSTPTAGSAGILVRDLQQFTLDNLQIQGFYINLNIVSANNSIIDNCEFMDAVLYNASIGDDVLPDAGDMAISNCFFLGYYTRQARAHIYYHGGGGLKIINSKFNRWDTDDANRPIFGIFAEIAEGATSDLLINNCSIENFDSTAIYIKQVSGVNFGNILINNVEMATQTAKSNPIKITGTGSGDFGIVTITGYTVNDYQSSANSNAWLALTNVNDVNIGVGTVKYFATMSVSGGTNLGTVFDPVNTNLGLGTLPTGGAVHVLKSQNSGSLWLNQNSSTGSSAFAGFQLQDGSNSSYVYQTSSTYSNGGGLPNALYVQNATANGPLIFLTNAGPAQMSATRFELAQGTPVTAANSLTLGNAGNTFPISGNTQINAITTSNWQAGSEIGLLFSGTPTVKNNTAGAGGTATLLLAGGQDFVAAPNDYLGLFYDGSNWHEKNRKVAASGGAGVYTFSNGITESPAGTVKLGGTLSGNTTIDGSTSNELTITGSTSTANGLLYVNNTLASGVNTAIKGNSIDGAAVSGNSTNGNAITGVSSAAFAGSFTSTSSIGVKAVTSSSSSEALALVMTPSSTNTVRSVATLYRQSSGTPATGIGAALELMSADASNAVAGNKIISKLTDATHATVTTNFIIQGQTLGGALTDQLTIGASGELITTGAYRGAYRAITALRTLDATDYMVNCTANSFTVTLPTAVGITGRMYIIKNTGGATTITIATTSSQTIDGSAPTTITTLIPMRVMSDGANWITW